MKVSKDTTEVISLVRQNWFDKPGAYVMIDGQFGSTGKGLLASLMALVGQGDITDITTNAAPNSGHTAYFDDFKIMTQQIPVASVVLNKIEDLNFQPKTIINAGAVVDSDILLREIDQYGPFGNLYVHGHAALIEQQDRDREAGGAIASIATTAKGVGAALARKVLREGNVADVCDALWGRVKMQNQVNFDWDYSKVFVETAQGFSLGINSGFYPHCTSRECSVQQAISDAHIPYNKVRKVAMCLRTFPIRVGNTNVGYSGDCYPDQTETTWEALGLEPELTSVTKRVRRVFSWSRIQFREAVAINQPDLLFLNFCNYLDRSALISLLKDIYFDYHLVMGEMPENVLLGFGPTVNDIKTPELLGMEDLDANIYS